MWSYLPIIVLSVALNAGGQIFLRQGMLRAAGLEFGLHLDSYIRLFSSWPILAGLACYGLSMAVWMVVLAKVPVSIAYPCNSLGFLMTAVLAWLLLGEPISLQKMLGIAVICVGVFIVATCER